MNCWHGLSAKEKSRCHRRRLFLFGYYSRSHKVPWVMEEGNALRKRWEQYSENYLRFWGKSAKILLYIYGVGEFISFCLRNYGRRTWLWQTEMRQLLSARLGSARLGRSIAPFFQRVKSYFIQFITNQLPETGRIMPWLRLFAFVGRMVVWYWSPNHDRQINLFRLNLLSSPACPLSEEVNSG